MGSSPGSPVKMYGTGTTSGDTKHAPDESYNSDLFVE